MLSHESFVRACDEGGSTRDYHATMRDVFRSGFYALMFNSPPSLRAEIAKAESTDEISHSHSFPLIARRMLVAVLKLRCKFSRDGFAYCIARWPQLVEDAQKSIVAATRRPGQTDVDAIKHLFMVQVRFSNEIQSLATLVCNAELCSYTTVSTGELSGRPPSVHVRV